MSHLRSWWLLVSGQGSFANSIVGGKVALFGARVGWSADGQESGIVAGSAPADPGGPVIESFSSRYSLKSSLKDLQRPATWRRKLIECF